MNNLRILIENRKLSVSNTRINENFEQAKELAEYLGGGLNTLMMLRLFKKYGKDKVLNLRSFLKDYPYDPKRGLIGIAIWKLKQN